MREASASTKEQHLLCNTILSVDPGDNRRLDVVATGTDLYHGRVLFCDATVRSPLKGNGQPLGDPRAATTNGAVLRRAKQDKEKKYRDLVSSPLAELLVLACEVGGRWNDQATELVRALAKQKVKNEHPLLRRSAELAWHDRWWSLLGVAVQDALAASLLANLGKQFVLDEKVADEPSLDNLLDGQR